MTHQRSYKLIPIQLINFPPALLRLINRRTLEYIELRDSIKSVGLLNSICVRPISNQYRSNYYDIIDGVHRYVICKDLGWTEMPCIVLEGVTNEELPWLQMQANAHRRTTSPAEYAALIRKLLIEKPDMSIDELCARLNKKPTWVKQVLSLLQLCDEAKKAVALEQLPLLSAYALAKLPKKIQECLLPWALVMASSKFVEVCGSIIRGYREAKSRANLEAFLTESFDTPKFLRSFKQICLEHSVGTVGAVLIQQYALERPIDAWRMALAWVLHIDPISTKIFKTKLERKQRALNELAMTKKMDKKREIQAMKMKIEGDSREILT